jgi:hypothetical protein
MYNLIQNICKVKLAFLHDFPYTLHVGRKRYRPVDNLTLFLTLNTFALFYFSCQKLHHILSTLTALKLQRITRYLQPTTYVAYYIWNTKQ